MKCVNLSLPTWHNTVYGPENVVPVLLYMCKNGTTASRSVTELSIMFRDDQNVSIPTAQWLLGMIGAMDPDKMDALCRRIALVGRGLVEMHDALRGARRGVSIYVNQSAGFSIRAGAVLCLLVYD